jgi:uncharacterized phiE125 gp8 family phage protein
MIAVLKTAPAIEPLTLLELADHLRIDTDTFAESLLTTQSILPGSHGISALGAYTHVGAWVSVIGKQAIVNLNAGTVGAGGTVEAKIQESDDNATWTDWTGGGFTLVNAANDNAIQEKAYTGTKAYIRVVAKVLVAACEFGADIITQSADTVISDDLTDAITDGREMVENITRRALLSQTWYYYLDAFPSEDFIKLPFGNLQSAGLVITYKDSDGTTTTMTVATDYLVELNGEGIGRIVLPYGESWPSDTLYPSNPICIEYACGWTAAASLPKNIKRACKFASEDSYYHGARHEQLKPIIENLLSSYRLWDEF